MRASAAEPEANTRFYAGGALGGSSFDLPASNPPAPDHSAKTAAALKGYFGYRLSPYFSLEAGYARLGSLNRWTAVGGGAMEQKGVAQAFYGAAAGRWAINPAFALNGRVGVASSKISDTNTASPPEPGQGGRATGLMLGAGAEYSITPKIALTADYDHFDRVSKTSKGGMVTVGARFNF